jgi:hypothetical protein
MKNAPLVPLRYLDPASIFAPPHDIFPDGVAELRRAHNDVLLGLAVKSLGCIGLRLFLVDYTLLGGVERRGKRVAGTGATITLQLLDQHVNASVEGEDGARVVTVKHQVATSEKNLARSRHSGRVGRVNEHEACQVRGGVGDARKGTNALEVFFCSLLLHKSDSMLVVIEERPVKTLESSCVVFILRIVGGPSRCEG